MKIKTETESKTKYMYRKEDIESMNTQQKIYAIKTGVYSNVNQPC